MRDKPTLSEETLWDRLRGKRTGFKFWRQAVILGWVADFYCAKSKLVVEVDGNYHAKEDQIKKDAKRDSVMKLRGFYVMRVTSDQVLNFLDETVEKIRTVAAQRSSVPPQVGYSKSANSKTKIRHSKSWKKVWPMERRIALWLELRHMPPLSHWPDCPAAFDWSRSQVVSYIRRLMAKRAPLCEAIQGYELSHGKKIDVIRFDPKTKLWSGNPEWTPETYLSSS